MIRTPVFTREPEDHSIICPFDCYVPHRLVLHCEYDWEEDTNRQGGYWDGANLVVPSVTIQWYRDGVRVKGDNQTLALEDQDCDIDECMALEGDYHCALNATGIGLIRSRTATVRTYGKHILTLQTTGKLCPRFPRPVFLRAHSGE